MKIILVIFNHHIIGKNKYNPINVMPTTASPNFAMKNFGQFHTAKPKSSGITITPPITATFK